MFSYLIGELSRMACIGSFFSLRVYNLMFLRYIALSLSSWVCFHTQLLDQRWKGLFLCLYKMKDPLDSSYRVLMICSLFGISFHLSSVFERMNSKIATEIFQRCFICQARPLEIQCEISQYFKPDHSYSKI